MIVYREREPRMGRHICHIFEDCRVLRGKAYDPRSVPESEDRPFPTCKGCLSGATVPGHHNDREAT